MAFLFVAFMLFFSISAFADYNAAARAYRSGGYATAFAEYSRLAEQGDVRSQLNVAWMLSAGEGIQQDKNGAVAWYLKAADAGDSTAQFNLGQAYETGEGTTINLQQALRWYKLAAEGGDSDARIYYDNLNRRVNEAARARTIAAKPVVKPVVMPKPVVKVEAKPVVKVEAKPVVKVEAKPVVKVEAKPVAKPVAIVPEIAVRQQAAAPTQIHAEVGSKAESSQVARIRRAADAGDVKAQVAMGWFYSSGKNVPQDKAQAVKWYRLAAAKGNRDAQSALGWMYHEGLGCERNINEAIFWSSKAASQGDKKAGALLKRLRLEKTRR